MFKFFPYVLKTLWRHRARTALTVSGSAVALFVFCFVGSVQEGLNHLQSQQEAKRSLIVFQANKFCPATSNLPQDYDRKIAAIPGVREVVPIKVFTNNCRASLDIVVFYGIPPQQLRKARDFKLVTGSWGEFEEHQDAAMVGQRVAARRSLKVDDRFSIGQHTVIVAGIYQSNNSAEENYIYTHLDFLQRGEINTVGTVTQFEVLLSADAKPMAASRAIDKALEGESVATDTRAKGAFQLKSLGDLTELIQLSHYLGFACVGLVLILVATTTLMAVQDRILEHAVLQTIGFTPIRIFGIVLTESVIVSLLGGSIGVLAAIIALMTSGLAVGAEAVTIAFTPTWSLALNGVIVAAITGLLAGLPPAWQAARTEIVPALRSV
ncbi:MAG: ABC transporter permease [Pirellulaceae bacterium]